VASPVYKARLHRAAQSLPRPAPAIRPRRKNRAAPRHRRNSSPRPRRGLRATPRAGVDGRPRWPGLLRLDQLINLAPTTGPILAPTAERPLLGIVDAFSEAVASFRPVTVTV
jgi:hypothetical protein